MTSQADLYKKKCKGVGSFKSQNQKHENRHRVEREFHVRDGGGPLKMG